ncbi:MAG: tetratricopeptide repeat protein [Pseudomonadota bacterium]
MSEQSVPHNGDADHSDEVVVTLDNALPMAMEFHQNGRWDDAEKIYLALLAHQPENSDALQFLGVLRHNQGRNEDAINLLKQASALDPDNPGLLLNMGNVMIEAGDADEAVSVYQDVLKLAPKSAEAWSNAGVLLRTVGQLDLAEEALRKSIELNPEEAAPWHNLGNLLISVDRVEEAVQCALRATTYLPQSRVGRKLLATAYAYLGETEKAKEVLREWLEEIPGDPSAEHHLAALENRMPDRASDAYVETVFDNFALTFDSRLENLEYRAPELVQGAVAQILAGTDPIDILDLGCGTGLCGPLVRPHAKTLVGIDLSQKMLDRAHTRKSYDTLEKAEFIAYLKTVPGGFGMVIAADALCYVGRMEEFSQNCFRALEPGGTLIATFEADPNGQDISLPHTGRYTHGDDYLRRTFQEAGFEITALSSEVLRMETAAPVNGWLLIATRPA